MGGSEVAQCSRLCACTQERLTLIKATGRASPITVAGLAAYARDLRAAAPFYAAPGVPIDDGQRVTLSPVQNLEILTLIDWYAASPALETEAGLSYVIQADRTTLLLDLGLNDERSIQPPLRSRIRTPTT
jgi:hypothetical protein